MGKRIIGFLFITMLINILSVSLFSISKLDQEISIAEHTTVADSVLRNLYFKGFYEFKISDPVKAIYYLEKLVEFHKKNNNQIDVCYRNAKIGQLYHKLGMHQLALEYLMKASNYLLKTDKDEGLAWLYSDIGNVYFVINQFGVAQPYYNDGLELMEKIDNKYGQSVMLNNIALCQARLGQIDQSFENLDKALKIREKFCNAFAIYHSKSLIAENYTLIEEYDKANELYEEIWTKYLYDENDKDEAIILRSSAGLALFDYQKQMKNYPLAEQYLEDSIDLIESVGDHYTLGLALEKKAKYYEELNRNEDAITILKGIFDYAYEHNFQKNAHSYADRLIKLSLKQNNIKDAAEYFNKYTALTDTLLANKAMHNLVELHSIIQNHIKEVENNHLRTLNKTTIKSLIVSSSLFFIIVILSIAILFKDKKNYKKIKNLANASSEGIVIHDRGLIIEHNNQFLKMFGELEKGPINKNLLDFSCDENKDEFKKLLKANETMMIDAKMLVNDNKTIDVKISSRPYVYRRKEVRVAVIQDVTTINQYINSIIDTQKELKVLNSTKDKLFSIIAHDLKNPFNAIIGFSDFMKESWRQIEPEDIDEMLSMIHESSVSAHTLLENLLDWARIQTGKLILKPTSFQLINTINEVVSLLTAATKLKQINVELDCDDSIFIYADNRMVSTIIRNLLTNAIKFTHIKGNIKIQVLEDTQSTRISIEDNGTGIDKEYLANLFHIDKINSNNGTNQEKGTGLGLILCKELVELQNGKIEVESQLDKGSKFTVIFPRNLSS